MGDVVLPPWAADARDFLYQLREALESPLVSARLHKWIDLVFGRKARGDAAVRADNVFHYLTYDEVALEWLAREQDPAMRDALRLQMMEFGRTPQQVGYSRAGWNSVGCGKEQGGGEAGQCSSSRKRRRQAELSCDTGCLPCSPALVPDHLAPLLCQAHLLFRLMPSLPLPAAAVHPQAPQAPCSGPGWHDGVLWLLRPAICCRRTAANQSAHRQALRCPLHLSSQQVRSRV